MNASVVGRFNIASSTTARDALAVSSERRVCSPQPGRVAATSSRWQRRGIAHGRRDGGDGVVAAAGAEDDVNVDVDDIPVVSAEEVHARLAAYAHPRALETFAAFYSSW